MLIIYFLLGLGITTAHSDNGVSFRAQKFDKTIQNIDKEAYIKHQREKRFVTGYSVPQNVTNNPQWGNLNITNQNRNNTSNASGYKVPVNSVTPRNMPYPGYPGYPAPNAGYQVPNTGYPAQNTGYPAQNTGYPAQNTGYPAQNTGYPAQNTGYPAQNTGYPAQNTGYPASNTNPGQNYNTTVTRPVYPNYNNIIVRPANKNNFNNSNPSGYNVQPVNPTPGNKPYYPVPNTGYPASNTGYPAPSGYPVPNTFYPPSSSVIPPVNVTGFVPKPNPGFTIHDAVPRNNSNGFYNNGNGFNNSGNNSTITKEETSMQSCIISCNFCPAGMKRSAFGTCVKDLDYDDE